MSLPESKYHPKSDFLNSIIADEVPLVGSEFANRNLVRLIEMTRDSDLSNRDWATMLLSDVELDTPAIRSALLEASRDPNSVIRGEALCGLAQRDKPLALPLVKAELMGDDVAIPTLDAAQKIASFDLVGPLKNWLKEDRTDQAFDRWLLDAIHACEKTDTE